MSLSDAEKRDAIKLIERGKPLPDEYRFKLFEDKREVELVWNGKTNEVTNVVLPFQTIEHVDEPRAENSEDTLLQMSMFDTRGRQVHGWTNKLIWGDNKLILSSLKNGPLREEIEAQGGIKLIYIDPPFDVGADFSMDIEIGGETLTKKASVIEELAYRDTWGKGTDSFIAMIYERLMLMRDLLADDGSIFVHCDWRVSSLMNLTLAEVFGKDNFQNEIIWYYTNKYGANSQTFDSFHNTIFWYGKGKKVTYSPILIPVKEKRKQPLRKWNKVLGKNEWQRDSEGNYLYIESNNKEASDVWEIPVINPMAHERMDYPTQKPEILLSRVLESSSNPGDLVADLFSGSGTTLAVAEKMGRKWIGSDLGKFSIHSTRKRMIGVQRELKEAGKDYRAFEILNLGKYQREHFVGVNPELADEQKQAQLAAKEAEYTQLIIQAYRAQVVEGFRIFNAKRAGRMVAIGPVNVPVNRLFVDEVVKEASENKVTKIDILAFDFEMGLSPHVQEDAKKLGIDLALKYIPPDVFDKRAIEKNQVKFFEVGFIEVKPKMKGRKVAIELTDFSVFYNQDESMDEERALKPGSSKVVIRDGQVIKLSKDKESEVVSQEILTKEWTDWIDYWSVDFNFESKKEMIRRPKKEVIERRLDGSSEPSQISMDYEEVWTGSYVFENEWQDFRTRKKRDLELTSVAHPYAEKGRYKIAIKVVDIFGNDTMKVIEVNI